ncbi:Fic family protein [Burkholderia seminalis]|uniref:Fic family protein n=1 Tax=Burkholderia seminalis TaxID=488731 RepID=UPI001CF1CCA1|nr:Fic family protein [Burkholderia seminalis]MCA8435427.1 Fic family protein [Burkholderia seminalis]
MLKQISAMLNTIDADKATLDAARPLPHHTVASLREKLLLEWTYHSNAIEGNTLTLRETKVVLEGITVGGKSLREHFEATNHRDAIIYVEDIVSKAEALSEWQIRNIHSLVLKGIDAEEAGRYRRENVVIAGASTTPPDFMHLPAEMATLVAWYEGAGDMHPVERATELHTRFVKIHPFIDGNGRTGRLLLNFELMKAGYPPAIIRKDDRLAYYDSLDKACLSDDYDDIVCLVAESVKRSLDTYFDVLGLRHAPVSDWAPPSPDFRA